MANYYRDALEALGKVGRRSAVRNAFNRIAAQSDDPEVRRLAAEVIEALEQRGTNTEASPVKNMGIPAGKELHRYCSVRAYNR